MRRNVRYFLGILQSDGKIRNLFVASLYIYQACQQVVITLLFYTVATRLSLTAC